MGLKRRKLPAYLPICLPAYMSTYLPSYLPNLHVDESATLMITNVYALRKEQNAKQSLLFSTRRPFPVLSATTLYLDPLELIFTLS